MDKKLLVLDIDGTLTNTQKEVTPRTLNAIHRMMEDGHLLALASGRPTPGMKHIADTLSLETRGGFLLSYNGANITNYATKEILFQQTLPAYVISEVYDFCLDHHIGMITYDNDVVITGTPIDEYMELEARINHLSIRELDQFVSYVTFPVNKCLVTAPIDIAPEMEHLLQERYKDELSIYRSEPFFIEIMPKNIDKAASIERLIQRLSIPRKNVIACGDGFNDLSMIEYAGLGVAMENAQDVVKQHADYITASNDEDGVAKVIEKFIL